jgi:hypothetical protein
MTIRYGNDVELTELAIQITKETASLNAHLRDGNLHSVFLRAHTMEAKLEKLKERLNQIQLVP